MIKWLDITRSQGFIYIACINNVISQITVGNGSVYTRTFNYDDLVLFVQGLCRIGLNTNIMIIKQNN